MTIFNKLRHILTFTQFVRNTQLKTTLIQQFCNKSTFLNPPKTTETIISFNFWVWVHLLTWRRQGLGPTPQSSTGGRFRSCRPSLLTLQFSFWSHSHTTGVNHRVLEPRCWLVYVCVFQTTVIALDSERNEILVQSLNNQSITMNNCSDFLLFRKDCSGVRNSFNIQRHIPQIQDGL